jgi:hypothetical protein
MIKTETNDSQEGRAKMKPLKKRKEKAELHVKDFVETFTKEKDQSI